MITYGQFSYNKKPVPTLGTGVPAVFHFSRMFALDATHARRVMNTLLLLSATLPPAHPVILISAGECCRPAGNGVVLCF
jgi:hypothetical protein